MESPEQASTPEDSKKKNYGSILIIVFIVGIISYFGGKHVYNLCTKAPIIDTTSVKTDTAIVVKKVDSVKIDTSKVVVDTIKK